MSTATVPIAGIVPFAQLPGPAFVTTILVGLVILSLTAEGSDL